MIVNYFRVVLEIRVFEFWGSMVARLKLEGIDGKAQQGVDLAA